MYSKKKRYISQSKCTDRDPRVKQGTWQAAVKTWQGSKCNKRPAGKTRQGSICNNSIAPRSSFRIHSKVPRVKQGKGLYAMLLIDRVYAKE